MIDGASKGHDGIKLTDIARFQIENVDIKDCDKAIHSLGGLIWEGRGCYWTDNNYGLYTRAGAVNPNLIKLYDCAGQSNTSYFADIGKADGITLENCDIEGNGTTATTTTGGVILRDTGDDGTGICKFTMRDCWFESGLGWDVTVEDMTNALITLENNLHYAAESGRCIWIKGGSHVLVKQCFGIGSGDTLQLDSGTNRAVIISSIFNVITDNAENTLKIGTTKGGSTEGHSIDIAKTDVAFTPKIDGSSSAGAGTYSVQYGSYSVIGNQVFFHGKLTWSAHTGTGNLLINLNDIPYTSKNVTSGWPVYIVLENVTYTGDPAALLAPNSKIIDLYVQASGAGASSIALDAAANIYFSGWYDR
jgi:hypothetical protein